MDEEKEEEIKEIINDVNRDVREVNQESQAKFQGYTRKYQEYREEAKKERELNWYEKLCYKSSSILNINADKSTREKLDPPIKLLGWEITPGMVLSASIMSGLISFFIWGLLFVSNLFLGLLPITLMLFLTTVCLGVGVYVYYKPQFAAKEKVIRSSGEMILSILYMVIYMRNSPNMEGAIRFAALNLDGPISNDLKKVLWDIEIGKFNQIEESLKNYTDAWKYYNEDYIESLEMLEAAMNEKNPKRRDNLLNKSIDRILDSSKERMKHYAQGLKTPVMILNAMGAMLPVLALIMLPLISVFMGSAIGGIDLMVMFNILLPLFLFLFMKRVLSSRPPSVDSEPVSKETLPERGYYDLDILSNTLKIPTKLIGFIVFLFFASYGIVGYLIFPVTFPLSEELAQNPEAIPSIFTANGQASPLPMLMRSLSIVFGIGFGIGVSKLLGNRKRYEAEQKLQRIESEFPGALFQLGNKVSGGTPIEMALSQAAQSTSDLEISGLFEKAAYNVQEVGMTFEEAIFDKNNGAIKKYPSRMIQTVMRAIIESSEKGTRTTAMAMTTISNYLENIHETQETLKDLLEETTTTIQMLAYLLAPVVAGVAVGMSQTIITTMVNLGKSFSDIQAEAGGSSTGTPGGGLGGGFITENLDTAISPEILLLVVGIYLVQLHHVLGTFYTRIEHGEDKTYQNLFIGKILITGITLFTVTVAVVSILFGGLISGISA